MMTVQIEIDKQDEALIALLANSEDGTIHGYYTIQTNLETHDAFELVTNNQSAAIDTVVQSIIDAYSPEDEVRRLARQAAKYECLRRVKKELPSIRKILRVGKGENDTEEEEGDAQSIAQGVFQVYMDLRPGVTESSLSGKVKKAYEIEDFRKNTVATYINDPVRTLSELKNLLTGNTMRNFFAWPDNT